MDSDEIPDPQDKASKLKGALWLFGTIFVAGVFALGLGPFARAFPWSWEAGLAQSFSAYMPSRGCTGNAQAQALLEKLERRLYPVKPGDDNFSIHLQVVTDPAVNAFAGLGGEIIINSGFLDQAQSADEVAGVLAHEIEHVRRRHILQGVFVRLLTTAGIQAVFSGGDPGTNADWAQYFFSMGFTRTQEEEADEGGLARLQEAHIDNAGFRKFFERMGGSGSVAEEFLSDHPTGESRAAMVRRYENRDTKPVMTDAEWQVFRNFCQ